MSIDIDPKIWGGPAWIFLQNVAKGYPMNPTPMDKNNYKIMFDSLKNTLPCSKCRSNYRIHLKQFPLINYLNNRKSLLTWVRLVKNKSNNRTIAIENSNNVAHNDRVQRIKNRRITRARGNCKTCGKN